MRKLSRKKEQRKALLINLCRSLFLEGRVKTTQAKAKELRKVAEKFITKAKESSSSSQKELSRFFSPDVVDKLINEIGPKYKERPGGYTRVLKLGPRKSDGAEMAIIEMV